MIRPPISTINAARHAAAKIRARTMARVAAGQVSPLDVIRVAHTAEGIVLRRLTLRHLLAAQPGWGDARASRVLDHLRRTVGGPDRLTVGWLIDRRTGRSRLAEFVSVAGRDRADSPWVGFPYLPGGGT